VSGTTNVPSVYVIIKDGSKALFVPRSNTGFNDGQYAVPSGHVEDDETFRKAAVRELKEEVGLTVNEANLEYQATIQRKGPDDIRVDVWFESNVWQGRPINAEPEKHSMIEWLDITSLPQNVVDYMSYGIEQIKTLLPYKFARPGLMIFVQNSQSVPVA